MTAVVAAQRLVESAVTAALARVLPLDLAGADPLVRRSEHADFQSSVALALAKPARRSPQALARDIAGALDGGLDGSAVSMTATVSGPGFLNLTVTDAALWDRIGQRLAADRLGVEATLTGERVVVDYSGPNIAKEMHVGHLRSTIIGDALVRVLGFLGAAVVRQNHLGDWGTQFGMLIQYLDENPAGADGGYRAARARFDADPAFADRARARVVALQAGDPASVAVWRALVDASTLAFQARYDRLGVLLTPADSAGESTYNDDLADVVAELAAAGIAVDSDGALCVFFPGGDPVPLIVRKKDGGYGYAATDLATIRHRVRRLEATRVLYVHDARQSMHFRMVFDTARRAGWLPDDVTAVHVPFGTVLDADGRPFRTRSGGTVPLDDLLDAAVDRARAVVAEKQPGLDAAELDRVAHAVGIGAVKYADLSNSRTKDYAFDIDRMVAFTGNTGVYLQFAHARIRSILRRLPAGTEHGAADSADPAAVDPAVPLHPAERALALGLDGFADALADVTDTLEPHRLCTYLYALAKAYTDFYESCPVLRADTAAQRGNRIALCRLTGRTLAAGLDLLGIRAPERL